MIIKPIKQIESTVLLLALASLTAGGCQESSPVQENSKPNIIYILADDLGYGDLSCYGQTKFSTPNIDHLAEQGMRFTQHYSGSTVCAPSRSSLMTGQHTGHTFIRGNKEWKPEGQYPLEDEALTVAELLKEAGYKTGAFGKWGLGYPGSEGDPNKQGFDEFFGYNCQRLAHNYYPYYLWHNQKKVMLEGNAGRGMEEYAPNVIHQEALKFIEKNKKAPFFLYYPSVIPHAELFAPESYMKKHRGKYLPEKVFNGTDDGEHYKNGYYGSQIEGHAAFAAMINLLDDQVGELVGKLKELGIYENTIIIFTSDNGPHLEAGADPKYFNSNGGLRGFKRDLYEGGIRVPMIIAWEGKIKKNVVNEHISAFWDVFPTLADLAGIEYAGETDGISFLPTLLGEKQAQHEYLYWEFHERGGRKALRQGDWKLVSYHVLDNNKRTFELYNLKADPFEKNDVAPLYPELMEQLVKTMEAERTESDIFTFQSNKRMK